MTQNSRPLASTAHGTSFNEFLLARGLLPAPPGDINSLWIRYQAHCQMTRLKTLVMTAQDEREARAALAELHSLIF